MQAYLLAMLVATSSLSPDAGVAPDAPRVVKLHTGEYLFSEPAFDAVNAEMQRLQKVEQEHKQEQGEKPWFQVILVSALVGVSVGLAAGFYLGRVSKTP